MGIPFSYMGKKAIYVGTPFSSMGTRPDMWEYLFHLLAQSQLCGNTLFIYGHKARCQNTFFIYGQKASYVGTQFSSRAQGNLCGSIFI